MVWSEKYHDVHAEATVFARQVKNDKAGVINATRDSLTGSNKKKKKISS